MTAPIDGRELEGVRGPDIGELRRLQVPGCTPRTQRCPVSVRDALIWAVDRASGGSPRRPEISDSRWASVAARLPAVAVEPHGNGTGQARGNAPASAVGSQKPTRAAFAGARRSRLGCGAGGAASRSTRGQRSIGRSLPPSHREARFPGVEHTVEEIPLSGANPRPLRTGNQRAHELASAGCAHRCYIPFPY